MEPQITKDAFCTYTGARDQPQTLVFLISGNPGLIAYYHPFLSLLAQRLTGEDVEDVHAPSQSPSFQIYGCSLAGFEVEPAQKGENQVLSDVEDQICFIQEKLTAVLAKNSQHGVRGKQRVILMGHSVGAYIAMEVLRRHRDGLPNAKSTVNGEGEYDIVGAVMLFPTVKDIAHSPSGRKLTTLLSLVPQFALVIGFFARLLSILLPSIALKSAIRFVMKNPPTHALETTFDFLKKPGGVRQALHMGADEMRTITSDKWSDDIWGDGTSREPIAKLFFYFGRNDHWVAEKTRDEIIGLRGRKDGLGPKMFVCEEGLPHAFCIRHNDVMAKKVAKMILEIKGN